MTWRAGGLLVQKLTREGGHGGTGDTALDEEDWIRARSLAETVEDHELLDPLLPPDRLLYRLFHEEQVRAYPALSLETYCSCSRERVEELLRRFTSEDLTDMVVDGEVWVTCEFCNSRYRFDPADLAKAEEPSRRRRVRSHRFSASCPGLIRASSRFGRAEWSGSPGTRQCGLALSCPRAWRGTPCRLRAARP